MYWIALICRYLRTIIVGETLPKYSRMWRIFHKVPQWIKRCRKCGFSRRSRGNKCLLGLIRMRGRGIWSHTAANPDYLRFKVTFKIKNQEIWIRILQKVVAVEAVSWVKNQLSPVIKNPISSVAWESRTMKRLRWRTLRNTSFRVIKETRP